MFHQLAIIWCAQSQLLGVRYNHVTQLKLKVGADSRLHPHLPVDPEPIISRLNIVPEPRAVPDNIFSTQEQTRYLHRVP